MNGKILLTGLALIIGGETTDLNNNQVSRPEHQKLEERVMKEKTSTNKNSSDNTFQNYNSDKITKSTYNNSTEKPKIINYTSPEEETEREQKNDRISKPRIREYRLNEKEEVATQRKQEKKAYYTSRKFIDKLTTTTPEGTQYIYKFELDQEGNHRAYELEIRTPNGKTEIMPRDRIIEYHRRIGESHQ
jgi:hypothetical protein